jgi:hypothetical protein
LGLSRRTQHRRDVFDDLPMRNSTRTVGESFFYALAKPFVIARLWFTETGMRGDLLTQFECKCETLFGGQEAGVFEDLGGGAAHGEIVAPKQNR